VTARRTLLLLALAAAACGKRGDPVPPGPAEAVTYPRTYPGPATVLPDGPPAVPPPPAARP
jgi:hypothetical protein